MVKEKFAKGLVGKPEGNGPLGRPSFGWENNARRCMEEIAGMVWNGLIWLV